MDAANTVHHAIMKRLNQLRAEYLSDLEESGRESQAHPPGTRLYTLYVARANTMNLAIAMLDDAIEELGGTIE